jgi:hypothetical protein
VLKNINNFKIFILWHGSDPEITNIFFTISQQFHGAAGTAEGGFLGFAVAFKIIVRNETYKTT